MKMGQGSTGGAYYIQARYLELTIRKFLFI